MKTRLVVATSATLALVGTAGVIGRASSADAVPARTPSVTTGAATTVTTSGATLNGSVNPNRSSTTAHFDFGLSAAYGSATRDQSVGSGRASVAVADPLTGLTAGATYHYRIVARNGYGTAYGADMVFTTPGQPAPTTTATPTPSTTTTATPTATTTTTPTPTTTTTTPTATTTTTPTATTTTAPSGAACTSPIFTTSDPNGGISNGGYYVHNNLWNASSYPGTKGTTQVCSYRSWNHVGTATNTGDGAVKTYPNVHKDYSGRTISSFPRLTSTYAATAPGVGIYNVAYDLWLNGVPNDEVMIWTDNHNQVPAGSRFASGVSLGGHTWDVYATSGNGYIAFVPSGGARYPSGTVDLKAMLTYLVGQGRVASGSTVDQICYGVEIVDTGGSAATWQFTDFSITDS
ncbi:GH12 family glycosyl hydrolase domain-containing protein [Pedococcus sp. 5OH_020]|uniref:GH12 family glycosyl hydrolase domain-containing protein n=1 Tax=Pedococcus sp. 5OH_020 TaxID=2989814 RepID=UPI0022E9FC9D|nr:hypothetical protein [Pedococcus sp. 5OH_020]